MKLLFLPISLLFIVLSKQSSDQTSIYSPDGKIKLVFEHGNSKQPKDSIFYYVIRERDTIIEKSLLGLNLNTEISTYNFRGKSSSKTSEKSNNANFKFKINASGRLEIQFKVFNNGISFRYHLPRSKDKIISKEVTSFNLPSGKVWIQPYDKVTKWSPGYEQPLITTKTSGNSFNEEGWCFPILFESNQNTWAFISEAHLEGNYPAMHLESSFPDGEFSLRQPEPEEANHIEDTILITNQWQSPWRFIVLGETLADIFDAKMIKELVPEPKGNYDWVKPGTSSWSWWSDNDSPQDPEKIRKFIDLAHDMKWDYSLIDANWDALPEDKIKSLIAYAEQQNVGVWLWYNSGGPHNTVSERPRDKMHIPEIRKAEFAKLQKWGVKGVKIDFFQSDKTDIIKQYVGIIEDAAKHKLMLNFHGSTLPRGWSETYPHVLTMESVRGAEAYAFNEKWITDAPIQNTIYPFTRNLTGPMDYTPVTFSKLKFGRLTTPVHELALSVIFTSGIQHFADSAESYLSQSSSVKTFLSEVPVVWDESKLLEGYPGSHVLLARRKGEDWYLAGINGKNEPIVLVIDFKELLGKNISIFSGSDGEISMKTVKYTEPLTLKLDAYGGVVLKID